MLFLLSFSQVPNVHIAITDAVEEMFAVSTVEHARKFVTARDSDVNAG